MCGQACCRWPVASSGVRLGAETAAAASWPQVGAQTETELKEKKLRVEDALNATKVPIPSLWSHANQL